MLYNAFSYSDFKLLYAALGAPVNTISNVVGTEVRQIIGRTATDTAICTMNPGTGPALATVIVDYAATIQLTGSNVLITV